MNMDTTALLDKLLPQAYSYTSCEGGFQRRRLGDVTSGKGQTFISNDEMALLDRRLPDGIRALEAANVNINGALIRSMLKLWSAPIFMETMQGAFVAIYEVAHVFDATHDLSFVAKGHTYEIAKVSTSGADILLPGYGDDVYPSVSKAWLDTKYPGWQDRFKVACDLGMTLTEAVVAMQEMPLHTAEVNLPPSVDWIVI